MDKGPFRLILAGVLLVILFLPDTGDLGWLIIFGYVMQYLARARGLPSTGIVNMINWLGSMLYWLAVPVLIPLNFWLTIVPGREFERRYRIFLFLLIPLAWAKTLVRWSGGAYGVWLWANPIIITAAGLMEGVFMVERHLATSGGEDRRRRLATITRGINRLFSWPWAVPVAIACCGLLAYASRPRYWLDVNQRR